MPTSKEDQMNKLTQLVAHPERYGDALAFTRLADGGLSITPRDTLGALERDRQIVMDAAQAETMASFVTVDPERAVELVAHRIFEHWKTEQKTGIIVGLTLLTLGAIIGGVFF